MLLERLAKQIAPAIENTQLYEERKKAEEEERQAAEESRVMAEIGKVITSSLNIDEVYGRLTEEVGNLIHFDRISVTIIDPTHGVTRPTYIAGIDVLDRHPGDNIPISGTMTEEVARSRLPKMLMAEHEDDLSSQFPGLVPAFRAGLRSFLGVPLVDHDEVIGVLQIRSKVPGVYSQRHLDLGERIGNQIAGSIANAQLHAKTRQAEEAERLRSQELAAILEVARILNHPDSFNSKVSRVMEELVRICDVDSATFRVPDEGGLRLVAAPGPFSITDALLPYQGNIPALAFEQREVIVADDYQNHPLAIKSAVERGTETAFAPPVISRGDVIGVVTVSAVHSNHFTPERVSLVLGIINGLGSLLENARLEDERKRTEERMHETARLASIGELAAGVAHEVNNPLTSVLGYPEMVLRSSIPDEYRKDIQTISDETQRAAKIVQNLIFFARKSGTEKQYIDLNSIVNRALEMKTYDFKVSNISVNSELSPKILKTMVDEHQLVQVLLNILTNAEQAIHEAGRAGHIDVRTRELDNRLEITIKDDGPGMPPEVLSKIFEPFFTTKEVGRGTGLGLSISYGIVKQHGGDVWVENSAAKGTKFHINLPVAGPEESALSQVAPAASLAKVTRHLLVVGDEPHIRDLLRRYLMSERYTVDLASGGREAWRKLTNMEYSCIILDLKMPGMSGRELYQRMRRSSQTLANKVVLISGDTISLDTRDFISQMGNPLITKPFSLGELMRTVRDFWDRLPVTA